MKNPFKRHLKKELTIVEAMENIARNDNKENRAIFYRIFLDSFLFLPVMDDEPSSSLSIEGNFMIPEWLTDDGQVKWGIFTSEESFSRWAKKPWRYISMKGQAICKMALDATNIDFFVIDADSIPSGNILKNEIEQLASGNIPGVSKETLRPVTGTKIRMGSPYKYPSEDILNAVRDVLAKYENVEKAYFYMSQLEHNNPELTMGIAGINLSLDSILFKELYNLAAFLIPQHGPILFKILSNVEIKTLKQIKLLPFYKR